MKVFGTICLIGILISCGSKPTESKLLKNQSKEAIPIKIGLMYVGFFSIFTPLDIDCDNFEEFENARQTLRTFADKDTISLFMAAINELDMVVQPDYNSIDTRAKLFIHYDNQQIDTLCMDGVRVLKDGKYYRNSNLMRKTIQGIYNDESDYDYWP